ncbi:MAG TPA: type II secretion system F family protein [Polyangiaceae bacterium]|jgi:tight adherence protein C|nr:type II secretion system F family protein [Polyangiaceae bacterium]
MMLPVYVLRLLALASTAVALMIIVHVAASAPAGEGKRLGLRGLKRQRALQSTPFWSTLEPIVRWIGARFSGLVSDAWRKDLNQKIALAGDFLGLLPEETIGLSIITGLGGLAIGAMAGYLSGMGNILIVGGTLIGFALPFMRISEAAAERMKNVDRRLPSAIDLLALAMGAGLDFPGSVRQVVEKSGSPEDPVVEEFTLILQSLQLGRTRSQALEEFAARVPVDSVVEFVGAVVQAELRGNPVVDVLRIQAEVSRRKRTVRAEEAAAKAGVAMIGPLVLVFLCILMLIIAPIVMKLQDS